MSSFGAFLDLRDRLNKSGDIEKKYSSLAKASAKVAMFARHNEYCREEICKCGLTDLQNTVMELGK